MKDSGFEKVIINKAFPVSIRPNKRICVFRVTRPYLNSLVKPRNSFQVFWDYIQSTLVISNSKGLSEILRDTRSSTYQVCRIEGKKIWLTTFNKVIGNWTFEVRDILKILWKKGEIAPQEQFLLFLQYFPSVVRFSCIGRDQIFTSR